MKTFLRSNGLSLVLAALFVTFVVGQACAGWYAYNKERREHSHPEVTLDNCLTGVHFWEAIFENWESEFLQMAAYVMLTAFLFQRGSAESNAPDKPVEPKADTPWKATKSRGRIWLFEHSLSLSLFVLFAISFAGHVWHGARHHNAEAMEQGHLVVPKWSICGVLSFGLSRFRTGRVSSSPCSLWWCSRSGFVRKVRRNPRSWEIRRLKLANELNPGWL